MTVLLDWHNAVRHLSPHFNADPRRHLPNALLKLQQVIARLLPQVDAAKRHRVTLRIYHGWHRNREATEIRRVFESHALDPNLARRISNVAFARGFEFGNELACGSARNPLYSTYRGEGQAAGQKMVDTAIACDLLHLLVQGIAQLAIVVSDDDDLLPPVFTASAWHKKAILLRTASRGVDHVTSHSCRDVVSTWEELQ